MNPLLCTIWDGCHLWLQWGDTLAPYAVEVRFRCHVSDEWSPWSRVLSGLGRSWAVIPTWREGELVEARVIDAAGRVESASLVDFLRSRCRFRIASDRRISLPRHTMFHAIVDDAPCSYRTEEEIALAPGAPVEVEMESLQAAGWAQLDYAGHFTVHHEGVVCQNLEPSRDDVRPLVAAQPRIGRRTCDVITFVFEERPLAHIPQEEIAAHVPVPAGVPGESEFGE